MERNIIKIDEAGLKDDLKTLIRGTVEDTLNAMLDEEAADLCNAEKHERSEGMGHQEAPEHETPIRAGKGKRTETGTGKEQKERKCSLNLMLEQTIFAKNP